MTENNNYKMLNLVLEGKFVLIVVFIHFLYKAQEDLVDK